MGRCKGDEGHVLCVAEQTPYEETAIPVSSRSAGIRKALTSTYIIQAFTTTLAGTIPSESGQSTRGLGPIDTFSFSNQLLVVHT